MREINRLAPNRCPVPISYGRLKSRRVRGLSRALALLPSPFPKAEGFSAYRMPGVLVHGPVILLFVWVGARLCLGEPWTYAPVIVDLIAGIYLGGDLAILATTTCSSPSRSWAGRSGRRPRPRWARPLPW